MAGRLAPDGWWEEIESLFPVYQQSPEGGRKPIDNRTVVAVFTVFTVLMFRAASDATAKRPTTTPSSNSRAPLPLTNDSTQNGSDHWL